jgi:hypothetical protein
MPEEVEILESSWLLRHKEKGDMTAPYTARFEVIVVLNLAGTIEGGV